MTRATTGYLDLGDGRIYYEVAGEGDPAVLVHAGFVDSRMWDDQWQEFGRHYSVIRYDMRGFGRSDRATGLVSHGQDLYRVLKQLDIGPAALVGCSLGGATVLDVALEYPEMVSALVLVSTVPNGFEFQGEPPQRLLEMMAAVQQGDLALASELQMRLWVDGPHRESEHVDPLVRQRAAEMSRAVLAGGTWGAAEEQPFDPPAAGRLGQVHAPTLIVAGGLDDPEILRAADAMVGAIPGAQKVILAGCAHLPNMEKPVEFNQVVLDFLGSTA